MKVEQVEQIADGRHVARYIGLATAGTITVGVVTGLDGIGQVIAAAETERGIEPPVPFDELDEGGMLVIGVADNAAGREGRNGDHRNTRARPEEIDRLDEA